MVERLVFALVAMFGPDIRAKLDPVPRSERLSRTRTDFDRHPPTGSDEPTKRRLELQVVPSTKIEPSRPSAGGTMSVTRFEQVRAFVEEFRSEHGRAPSFAETRDALDLPASTVSKYLGRVLAA